jgi:hypothetical protein
MEGTQKYSWAVFVDDIMAGSSVIRQSKTILARSLGAGRSRTVSADDDLTKKIPRRQREPTERPQTNYLVETSAMKKRSIQLRHRAASTRIRSGIAFVSVCVLVGLVTFFAGAHAQVATPIPAATATPAPTATPFPTFAPGRAPPHP